MTLTLRVSAHPENNNQKHVELLKDNVPVMADFFDLPLNLGTIGVELLERYSPTSGIYNLDGTPYTPQTKDEHDYPAEDFFPTST